MALRTEGEIVVHAERAAVFDFVSDAGRLATCIPGCRELVEVAPGRYTAVLTTRVAFISLSFKVAVEVVGIHPSESIAAKISGDAMGVAGRVTAAAALRVSDAGEAATTVHYEADVALTGKLGGLGEPVFRATSAQLAREFAANVKKAIEGEQLKAGA